MATSFVSCRYGFTGGRGGVNISANLCSPIRFRPRATPRASLTQASSISEKRRLVACESSAFHEGALMMIHVHRVTSVGWRGLDGPRREGKSSPATFSRGCDASCRWLRRRARPETGAAENLRWEQGAKTWGQKNVEPPLTVNRP